jgi:hypothetical protein
LTAKKQKHLDQLAADIAAYLNKGGKITSLPTGETEMTWRSRLNPDATKISGDEDANVDSKKRRKPKLSD